MNCHIFLECKEQIEKMLLRLNKVENTEHIRSTTVCLPTNRRYAELKKIKRKKII